MRGESSQNGRGGGGTDAFQDSELSNSFGYVRKAQKGLLRSGFHNGVIKGGNKIQETWPERNPTYKIDSKSIIDSR